MEIYLPNPRTVRPALFNFYVDLSLEEVSLHASTLCPAVEGDGDLTLGALVKLSQMFHESSGYSGPEKLAFKSVFLPYLLGGGHQPLFTDIAIKLEGDELIVYKNSIERFIQPRMEHNDAIPLGYELKKEYKGKEDDLGKRFDIERLFRKYNSSVPTLREIEKTNPDLVEYIFGQEYDDLPSFIQKAKFMLPNTILIPHIWPLGMSMKFKPKYEHNYEEGPFRNKDEQVVRIGVYEIEEIVIKPVQHYQKIIVGTPLEGAMK